MANVSCHPGFELYHSSTNNLTVNTIVCTENGWKLNDGSKASVPFFCGPLCSNCTTESGCVEPSGYNGKIQTSSNNKSFVCDPGYSHSKILRKEIGVLEAPGLPVACNKYGWHTLRLNNQLGPRLSPCIKEQLCESENDCENNKVCVESACISPSDLPKQNGSFDGHRTGQFPDGSSIIPDKVAPGDPAILRCSSGYVIDTLRGPRKELELVTIANFELVPKDGSKSEFCRPGCLLDQECPLGFTCAVRKAVCVKEQCQNLTKTPEVIVEVKPNSTIEVGCPTGMVLKNAGGLGSKKAILVCVKDSFGHVYWKTEQGGKAYGVECQNTTGNGTFRDCQLHCQVSSLPTIFKVVGDHTQDVCVGDRLTISCSDDAVLSDQVNSLSPRCFGSAVDIYCKKMDDGSAQWMRAAKGNMPKCVPICSSNRYTVQTLKNWTKI